MLEGTMAHHTHATPLRGGSGGDAIGLAKLVKLGQSSDDTFFERQSKAILVSFLVVFSGFASLALLDSGRPPYVHLLDAAVIFGSICVTIVLWRTKSLSLAFTVVCSVGLGLLFIFFLMVGNRGADLMMPLVFPLLSVVIAGPRRSQKWPTQLGVHLKAQTIPRVHCSTHRSNNRSTLRLSFWRSQHTA